MNGGEILCSFFMAYLKILKNCREIGLDKLLITCIDGNIGSEKTIS